MTQTTYPSFGYMIANNATTVWEVWFFSASTYSHNHAMMTSVTEWALKMVVGLRPVPGVYAWRKYAARGLLLVACVCVSRMYVSACARPRNHASVLVCMCCRASVWPQPLPGVLEAASGHYASAKGMYEVSWAWAAGVLTTNVTVPVDCEAYVLLPPTPTLHLGACSLPV